MSLKLKKKAKYLSYRKRHLRLTSNDQVRSRKWKKIIFLLLCKRRKFNDHGISVAKRTKIEKALRLAIAFYLSIVVDDQDHTLDKPLRLDKTIDSFCDSDCNIFFRYLKEDLKRLLVLLKFPRTVWFQNRSKMRGEEVFLRGLYELVSGETKYKIAKNVFGRDFNIQSRVFSWFIDHIFSNFKHLVNDNLAWWFRNGFVQRSGDAIWAKMISNGYPRDGPHNNIAFFIDCNCMPTQRVGGGPAEDGANAARWDENITRAFYNGWKSVNGLKHQTVDDAYGFTNALDGPTSLRRNDNALLRISDINDRMLRQQEEEGDDDELDDDDKYKHHFVIFGDSAYRTQSHIKSYVKIDAQDPNAYYLRKWHSAMKKTRISIEWNYGTTGSLFKYFANHQKLKLLECNTVTKVYTVATLLRNCHAGLYGCQTSNYFNISAPSDFIEHYLSQTDFV